MAAATSAATGRRYGVARVCRIWEVPRSSFYAAQRPAGTAMPPNPTRRRGPRPAIADDGLLAAIRADFARSPWPGEGHRKVWARLRVMDGIRVSRKRVLRLMREHTLLSPHRSRVRPEAVHERHIITDAPNVMWATDATPIVTVQDGKIWLFGCQSARKRDPQSASKRDPPAERFVPVVHRGDPRAAECPSRG